MKHSSSAIKDIFDVQGSMVCHVCEYMLLIDKVKQPQDHFLVWNQATKTDFPDFSAVFLQDEEKGMCMYTCISICVYVCL